MVARIARSKGRHAGDLELKAERHSIHQEPYAHRRKERQQRTGMKTSSLEHRQHRPCFKKLRLRETKSHGIAHWPLYAPSEQKLRDIHQHQRNENFVRMKSVTQKRRESAPDRTAYG